MPTPICAPRWGAAPADLGADGGHGHPPHHGPEVPRHRDRGKWVERKGFWMMATFHPAAILRDESKRTPTFEDPCAARTSSQLEDAT